MSRLLSFVRALSVLTLSLLMFAGCASQGGRTEQGPTAEERNPLTHGNVQLHLRVGQTSQAQVLEVFGAPDIATIDGSGKEVWTYKRSASVSRSRTGGGGFFLLLGGYNRSSSSAESTQRRMTLLIKFNEKKIVSDFKSRTSSF